MRRISSTTGRTSSAAVNVCSAVNVAIMSISSVQLVGDLNRTVDEARTPGTKLDRRGGRGIAAINQSRNVGLWLFLTRRSDAPGPVQPRRRPGWSATQSQ